MKRDFWGNCAICGDKITTRKKIIGYPNGPFGKPQYKGTEEYCPYCNWRGTAGYGETLRQFIKENNNARI